MQDDLNALFSVINITSLSQRSLVNTRKPTFMVSQKKMGQKLSNIEKKSKSWQTRSEYATNVKLPYMIHFPIARVCATY